MAAVEKIEDAEKIENLRQLTLNMNKEDIQRFITEMYGEPSHVLWLLFEHAESNPCDIEKEELTELIKNTENTLNTIIDAVVKKEVLGG